MQRVILKCHIDAMFIFLLVAAISPGLSAQASSSREQNKGGETKAPKARKADTLSASLEKGGQDADCCSTAKWNACQLSGYRGCCVDRSLLYPYYCCNAGSGLVHYKDAKGKAIVGEVKAGHLAEVRDGKLISVPVGKKAAPKAKGQPQE